MSLIVSRIWSAGNPGYASRPSPRARSSPSLYLSAWIAVGHARRYQGLKDQARELRHSTASSTTVCVKPEETGPKRRYKLALREAVEITGETPLKPAG